MNVVLEISYDGTNYFGWQTADSFPTIEQTLEAVLQQILQHPITLQAASRTDRGVHADGQIANFFTSKPIDFSRLYISLNQMLPPDIRVLRVNQAENTHFHPALDAQSKEYHYRIANSSLLHPCRRMYYWHIHRPLSVDVMRRAALLLEGTHDFASLRNRRKNQHYTHTIRSIQKILIEKEAEELTIKIIGNSFLYKMARNIAGTLVWIGCGKIDLQELPEILIKKKRIFAGVTAPAHGLTLHKVYYYTHRE